MGDLDTLFDYEQQYAEFAAAEEAKTWEKEEHERLRREGLAREKEEDFEPSDWDKLPDLVLERIFSYLTVKEKYNASQVCRNWYHAFYYPESWSTFKFEDTTLTRRRFNYYSGWQYTLDHLRTQLCLCSVGNILKHLIFVPQTNFYNLYEFMNMISFYAEQERSGSKEFSRGIGSNVETLSYIFPCNQAYRNQPMELYGTGGKLLATLKRLMGNLCSLRCLQLVDLMLDFGDALHLLDEVCYSHCLTLRRLTLINVTRSKCSLLHIGVFLNLQILEISPQNLSEDGLYLLSEIETLSHLHIIQNKYTPQELTAVSPKAWKQLSKKKPDLQVHLQLVSNLEKGILWQDGAPVASIWYESPKIKVDGDSVSTAVEMYGPTLRFYGHTHPPKYHQSKSFRDRMDPFFVFLVNKCPNLTTLIIRERISTATVLLLASYGKKLKHLYIRRNAVILRNDWPKNSDWPEGFSIWLKKSCRSYETTEQEVSQILGFRWQMLSDKEFNKISPSLHNL
ncbi:unnamed protein product [Bemisia tabaci]|uniref:F-box domain-containing protein n=1 Tax=Bemisia tabaci TaxID=7038 RepID=A0A9P0AGX5_BEMTA|nr:unnamed protein product [Bemisia tabaci]